MDLMGRGGGPRWMGIKPSAADEVRPGSSGL